PHRHNTPVGAFDVAFAAPVLESVTGCAVHTTLEAGAGIGTIDLHVKMLKPVPLDQDLIAEGRIIHVSRSLGVSEASLRDTDGTLFAHATATCAILRRQSG